MKNYDLEIEKAKKEIIEKKKQAWIDKHGCDDIPKVTIKGWFVAQWETGFVVAELEELQMLPKRQRDKILNLGGLS